MDNGVQYSSIRRYGAPIKLQDGLGDIYSSLVFFESFFEYLQDLADNLPFFA